MNQTRAELAQRFEELTRQIMDRDGVDHSTAQTRAAAQDPQLYEAYTRTFGRGASPAEIRTAEQAFEKHVGVVQAREHCTKSEAVAIGAREVPDSVYRPAVLGRA